MISKNKLKELAAYRLQKRCDEEAVFVVEGPKLAGEALASGFGIRTVCATAEWSAEGGARRVERGEFYEVSEAELERLSSMKTPNQVWMLVERKGLDDFKDLGDSEGLVLALDRIQDPGNMGTMMRTADWYGIRHIVCSKDTVSCYNPKVVQASMGAVFRTRVDYVDLPQWLAGCGMPVYGASLQGRPITERLTLNTEHSPAVLLIGNESRGISPEAMAQVTDPVLIPNIGGTAESLNASVAAAILIDRLIG
ncbi:MAG: RNA methyltransferase [Bacteroidales bacterium]|nr:RNA methyltransferase [Bacteroidales bacterium]